MPPTAALGGIPQIFSSSSEAQVSMATFLTDRGEALSLSAVPLGYSATALVANLLLQATRGAGLSHARRIQGDSPHCCLRN